MLTGMQIAVLGGDARQLEVIRKLTELDAKVYLTGFEQLAHAYTGAVKEALDDLPVNELDAMILPVPGTNMEGQLETIFSNQNIVIKEELLKQLPEHCTIYSGISNSYLTNITQNANRKLVQLFERDDVAIYNSIPTVEGTIMMAIQHTDFTIHGSRVVVLGMGRVGMSIARSFHALGAKVSVGARKTEHLARITEMGLTPFHLSNLHRMVDDADICINTIPHLVITASVISRMPTQTLIIDLASKPGGTDFRFAEKRGIKAILAPGLPGIVAPKTAGKILANVLAQLLTDEYNNRRESQP